jgi:hypothetical protein
VIDLPGHGGRLRAAILAAVLGFAPQAASAQPTVTIPLWVDEAADPARAAAADAIGKLAADLVESSNFNSYTRPEVLEQSIPEIQERYRRTAAGSSLVITYPSPVRFQTVGGDLWVLEIVIGLGRPDRVDALFTIDNAGRVVAHEKYSGALAVELRRAAAAAAGAP